MMPYSTYSRVIFPTICILLFVIGGCSLLNSSDTELRLNGNFSKETAIPSSKVNTLSSDFGTLLAGTTEGAYKKALGSDNWATSGLQIDSTEVVDFVFLGQKKLLAALSYNNISNPPASNLFKSVNEGNTWSPIEIDKPEQLDNFIVRYFDKQIDGENIIAYVGRIVKSVDQGNSWQIVFERVGFLEFIKFSNFHTRVIWTGGSLPIFSPYIAKSEDGGESWTVFSKNFYFDSDATVYDVVVHPDDADHVLAGVGGSVSPANVIRKSTDGGQSWETVYEGIDTRTFAHSAQDPQRVYASGRNSDGSLFFAASGDFGDSWQTVEWPESPAGVQVNDMISVMEDSREVLYFATNQGVFSYTFEE